MALRHAVLAELLGGEASGYELSKRFDVSAANFWAATPQQLYRELERLAHDGLLDARVVQQQRRPNKRMFTINEAGRAELHNFTQAPAKQTAIRDDLLVKLQAVDDGDIDAVIATLVERLNHSRGKLALYDQVRDRLLDGRQEAEYLQDAERVGPYLTLMRGRSFEQENLRWGEHVINVLGLRAKR
ncbi:MAG: PadR family transcriptional regulator, partial [Thermoleophilaceae bacterium]|nr:PadR family transcriptional regulator [Thermoleophilaceae bacterium]